MLTIQEKNGPKRVVNIFLLLTSKLLITNISKNDDKILVN